MGTLRQRWGGLCVLWGDLLGTLWKLCEVFVVNLKGGCMSFMWILFGLCGDFVLYLWEL